MRSIRLALVGYFLLMVGAALGAVYWFVNQTSAATLQAKGERAHKLLEEKYQYDCEKAKDDLDQRLLRNAQTLASLARSTPTHLETLYPLGALGIAAWVSDGAAVAGGRIPLSAGVSAEVMEDRPGDYYQINSLRGRLLEKSVSLGDAMMPLKDEVRRRAELLRGNFETMNLRPGHEIRRVTLKTSVLHFGRYPALPAMWRYPAPGTFPPGTGKSKFARPGGRQPKSFDAWPIIFIQYASDTYALDATLSDLKTRLDIDLDTQDRETAEALAGLQERLLWICGLAFVALLAGTYGLVRLGLAPLRKLSDAVSRVSVKNFRLQVESRRLPGELRPIATCLSETLEQLQRAFAREKQAAADISHELRTPLAALLTTLDVALRKPRTPQEYEEILEECRDAGTQMARLVERMLALARLDAGADTLRPREVDVIKLANQCTDLVRPLANARGVTVRLHAHGPAVLKADPDKLREVINNLLHNAIEYNKPNGSIDLAVERVNGQLAVEVRDTGIGISPEARTHIFERFFRADPSRHADSMHAGIGLAIVKGYVDLMGGTIGVDSSDAGSTFRLKFPVA
ncbi:MAG: hypothetical protein FJ271_19930 [Planctomycetes bacterium]|nr:hypothetical protein [Planctomycetota bacterium]